MAVPSPPTGQRPSTSPSQVADSPGTFVLVKVKVPLLGTDILAHYQLLVNVTCSRLIDVFSYSSTPMDFAVVTSSSKFQQLQEEHSEVFHPEPCQLPHVPPKHGIYHHIKMLGSQEKLQKAKQTFLHMEEIGLCPKASSPWAFPFI